MRRAFHAEVRRSIGRSLTRFGAILLIVALGAGFYAGLRMCAPDMRLTVDAYYDDTAFMDVHLISTLGFSEADVAAVRAIDGVASVMPAHVADVTATIGERRSLVRVHGLDLAAARASDTSSGTGAISADAGYLNRPILIAGRWPEAPGECVIDRSGIYANSAQIGDAVTLLEGVTEVADTFTRTEFTVVGVVDTSYYLSFLRGTSTLGDGSIDRVLYISDTDFAHPEVYTDLFLTVDGAAATFTFASAYTEIVDPVLAALGAIAPEREAARFAEVTSEAQSALDAKRAEYEAARADADAQLASAEASLAAAANEIADADARLAAARERYYAGVSALEHERASAATRFSQAQLEIDNSRVEIDAREAELDQLAAALTLLKQQIAGLEAAAAELQAAYEAALEAAALGEVVSPSSAEIAAQLAVVQGQLAAGQDAYVTQSATYDAGVAALATARAEIAAQQAALDAAREEADARFRAAERELEAAKREIASGATELATARQTLEEARAAYESEKVSAEAELAEALVKIEDAQAEIDAIPAATWYVLGRDENLGYASFVSDAERVEAISLVFPMIFFLVAALVALTTMTRMVDEERTLIGTYKALGYSAGRIASKYLTYAGLASISGSVVGILIGSQIMPHTIWQAYKTMYSAPSALTPIDLPIALAAGVASAGVTLLATHLAVAATLREGPAALMQPRAPKPGKRILLERVRPVWSRLSFSQKVTARNLFRYKKRLLMTVIGIAGCTALLLTGFGLRDSIADILDKQYGEIYRYNMMIGLELEETSATPEAVLAGMDNVAGAGGISDFLVQQITGVRISAVQSAGSGAGPAAGSDTEAFVDGYLHVPEDLAALDDFILLRSRVTGAPIVLGSSGAVITEKAAEHLDVGIGDTIFVEPLDATGNTTGEEAVALTIAGITEQYVTHIVYISPALYEASFGEPPTYNEALVKATLAGDAGADAATTDSDGTTANLADPAGADAAKQALSEALLARDGVGTVQFTEDITSSFDTMFGSLNSVVLVLIVSAGLLALIVLYNLTNINVTERQRELATIKVLGFYESEVRAYIYRETAALTAIGCALGLVLGIALEAFVIRTVEVDIVMFGRTIHATSYVYSAALTAAFAMIVNLAMRRRLRSIDMVESLKSVE